MLHLVTNSIKPVTGYLPTSIVKGIALVHYQFAPVFAGSLKFQILENRELHCGATAAPVHFYFACTAVQCSAVRSFWQLYEPDFQTLVFDITSALSWQIRQCQHKAVVTIISMTLKHYVTLFHSFFRTLTSSGKSSLYSRPSMYPQWMNVILNIYQGSRPQY